MQQDWAEAERCYRQSLTISERLGDALGAARSCNQLGMVAEYSGRPVEAEGWYKRALQLDEQVQPGSPGSAISLNNLASLLVREVGAGRAATTRLAEARRSAEQALAIEERLDDSSEIWTTLSILAAIAALEGRAEEARDYRRRERESFAAFAGNRYHIDRQHGQLIAAIAAAAQGNAPAREAVEKALPDLEKGGWKITAATRRIWAGERDWQALTEDLDGQEALLMRRVLEAMAQAEVVASLPPAVLEAVEQGDEAAFQRALEGLSEEEQQSVVAALHYLQEQAGEESGEGEQEEEGGRPLEE